MGGVASGYRLAPQRRLIVDSAVPVHGLVAIVLAAAYMLLYSGWSHKLDFGMPAMHNHFNL